MMEPDSPLYWVTEAASVLACAREVLADQAQNAPEAFGSHLYLTLWGIERAEARLESARLALETGKA